MKRPPAWLLRRRMLERPRALRPEPVTTEFYWCQPTPGDEQFTEWLRRAIRRSPGGSAGVLR